MGPVLIAAKALALWIAILVLAIANGALREAVLVPCFGTPAATFASGLLLSAAVFLVAFAGSRWYGPPLGACRAWVVGTSWLALTIVFEFSFGRWQGKSWDELLAAYTFADGNLWLVVLAVVLVSPPIAERLHR